MSQPRWWHEMADAVEAGEGPSRFTAAWYTAMRDEYLRRFPEADEKSKTTMRLMAEWAAAKEASHA